MFAGTDSFEVEFEPDMLNQVISLTINITDNDIALESDIQRVFVITSVSTPLVNIGQPSQTTVRIIDDDSELGQGLAITHSPITSTLSDNSLL